MTEREALKLALEALSPWAGEDANHTEQYAAYQALQEALAEQPAQQHWLYDPMTGKPIQDEQPAQQQEFVAWQPIETAPKKEVKILLRSFSGLIAEGYFLRAAYNGVGGWVWPYIHQNPVHWMPLPPPPVEAAHGIKENT